MEFQIVGCVFVAFCLFSLTQAGHLSQLPSDVIATVGSEVTMTCTWVKDHPEEQDAVEWKHRLSVVPGGERLFISTTPDGITDKAKFEVRGQYDLVIKDVQVTDAGRYGCVLILQGGGVTNTADLIVLAPLMPVMPTLIAGEHASLLCNIEFGSPQLEETAAELIPSLRAFIGNQEVYGEMETAVGVPGVSASRYRLIVNYTASEMDHYKEFMCMATTELPHKQETEVVPLNVLYPVKDLMVRPIKETYMGGEVINCSANGNPSPSYRWVPIQSPGPIQVSGAELPVRNNMVGQNKWKCIASNTVRQLEFLEKEITFTVEEGFEPVGSAVQTTWTVAQVLVTLTTYLAVTHI